MTDELTPETQPTPEETIAPEPAAAEAVPETAPVVEVVAAPDLAAEPAPLAEAAAAPAMAPSPAKAVVATPEPATKPEPEPEESFGDLLKEFEQSHAGGPGRREQPSDGPRQLQGTVVSLDAERVFLDIGFKVEGVLARSGFDNNAAAVKVGDSFPVSVKGRNDEGYYELSRFKVAQPRDWSSLSAAFEQKTPVVGTVTGVVKGGLTVDVGVRAFMPASRSGTREAAEMEKLVGTQITCLITKLDVEDEDVVVDRRTILEEQARGEREGRYAALGEGDIVKGTVRSLAAYGAFIDIGGMDGLLHISDIAHSRVEKVENVLTVGQELTVKILKIDRETRKISLGLKQLTAEPWTTAGDRYKPGDRVTGKVTRVADFGAFVEVEPGIEGLIHVSEMSWAKRVRTAGDLLKQGDTVDAVILGIKLDERKLSLGLKQTLADPWADVSTRFPVGSQISGPVTKMMAFGAFVQLAEGVEGLVHVSEIAPDKHIHHPQDVLRNGEVVKALVLAIDHEKRQIKLSIKQLVPTSIDEYIAEHKAGDLVTGRVAEEAAEFVTVELGEGVFAQSRKPKAAAQQEASGVAKADLSSLTSMLQARWKGNAKAASSGPEPLTAGQIRSFRITRLDAETKKIQVEPA